MAQYLPQTLTELRKISGFGDAKIDQYGQQFLMLSLNTVNRNGLSSLIHEKSPKRERKQSNRGKETKRLIQRLRSFRLYKEGKAVDEIAKERNLTIQTIEGHLSHYVSIGDINIEELVSREKFLLIEPAIKNFAGRCHNTDKGKIGQ